MSYYTEGYYKAGAEASRRQGMQSYFDVRNRQKKNNFAAGAALLNVGSTLWDTYSSNKELIDYAESKGLKTATSKFTNIFGSPEFSDAGGNTVTRSAVLAKQAVEKWNTDQSLLDTWNDQGGEK